MHHIRSSQAFAIDLFGAGHVLELCSHGRAAVTVGYACVIDIASDAIVAVVTSTCDHALQASGLIASAWLDARVNDNIAPAGAAIFGSPAGNFGEHIYVNPSGNCGPESPASL